MCISIALADCGLFSPSERCTRGNIISTKSIGVPHISTKNVGVLAFWGLHLGVLVNCETLNEHQLQRRVVDSYIDMMVTCGGKNLKQCNHFGRSLTRSL